MLFLIASAPLVYWYNRYSNGLKDLFTAPRLVSSIVVVYMTVAVIAYVYVPTYREHIEPSIATISLMIADGYPAYTKFDNLDVYSILYGPVTYIFQSYILPLFSNPIFGSKVYGATCFFAGFLLVWRGLYKKFGTYITLQGILYLLIVVLLFGQIAYRNQSDSIIFLGVSLSVFSVLLQPTWLSRVLLVIGVALSVSAKFHSVGYVLPLVFFYYRQYGFKNLAILGVISFILASTPFLLESYNFQNYISIMQAYSKLEIYYWLFLHNLSMAYVLFLPLLLLMYLDVWKTPIRPLLLNESLWTFVVTNIMIILVCLTAGIDGAGSYHLVQFAPAAAVLYAIYYSRYQIDIGHNYWIRSVGVKNLVMTVMIAWMLAILTFFISVQKKYIRFIYENASYEIQHEMYQIKGEIENNKWRVLMGYSDEQGYNKTFYRPILWSATKDNSLDPIALMGRHAVGIPIPDTTMRRISEKYYDVVIIPKPGKPFSMYNWHKPDQLIFGTEIPRSFLINYTPLKEYKHFTLWGANRSK